MYNPQRLNTIFVPQKPQQTDSHCGPAVLQTLLAKVNRNVTQDQIVDAAGARETILEEGTRPYQLANAVARLAPESQFWFKQFACKHDLAELIHHHQWPVAINWQGLFYDTEEEQLLFNPDGDHGHYSTVIDIDLANDKIVLADPYWEYATAPRIFSLKWFEKRWWDAAEDIDPYTGEEVITRTNHFMFIVAPKVARFPLDVEMELPHKLGILHTYD